MHEHLAAPLRDLLALYAEKYAEVSFPGLDLATLEAAAEQVEAAIAKVVEAEAEVEKLRDAVKSVEGDLTQKAARALSFLKVYVEGDESEYARLDALTQALLARPRARKTVEAGTSAGAERGRGRGRKPKSSTTPEAEVLEAAPSVEELAEADLPSSALSTLDRVAE